MPFRGAEAVRHNNEIRVDSNLKGRAGEEKGGRVCVRRDRRLSGIEPSSSHLSVDLESLVYRDEVALSLHLEVHGDYHGARPDQQHGMHKEKQQHAGQLGAGDEQLPAKRNARERGRGG